MSQRITELAFNLPGYLNGLCVLFTMLHCLEQTLVHKWARWWLTSKLFSWNAIWGSMTNFEVNSGIVIPDPSEGPKLWIISAAHPRKVSGSLGKVELSNLSFLWHHQYSSDVLVCGTWNTATRTPKVPRRSYIPHLMTWWGGNLGPLDKITRVKPCSEILHKKRHWLSVPIPSRLHKKLL